MEKITDYLVRSTVNRSEVRAWNETVYIPTYGIGKEEKNPIFLEHRVYQGSSGSVYPYPVVERIEDIKKDQPYNAFFIENEYIKVMVLPELGGRIQMAYDKVNKRHFVYYNQVIKPALVGLTGPWISGGIEFNWPQHHRPSTYLPIDSYIEEYEDGSKTIWCSELERKYRTKGMMGFTLYPGRDYIEIKVKVYNRTPHTQNFLWWANPAVSVDDHYYSVFPPDVNAVMDHGKRAVSTFPIATGEYYKQDYSEGVDISRYKNIPVPTSYMAINSKYDFIGGYEEDQRAGMLAVADHHINTGKKQWTWGNCDFGQVWYDNLTDEDGPYIELMTGMYCDNQPDFTWLQPYEEKSWVQYFMPYKEVGMVKNASKDVVVNLEKISLDQVKAIVYTTSVQKDMRILLHDIHGNVYIDEVVSLSPEKAETVIAECHVEKLEELILEVINYKGERMMMYQPDKPEIKPIPDPAKAAKEPDEIRSIEQLFLTGHHLEQYHHATYSPMTYYAEGLKRDKGDVRCNNAVGLLLLRNGMFAEAQPYFERAIKTQIERNPNPYNGEPYYNLGVCKQFQGDWDGSYDSYYKSTWSAAFQDSGYMGLAMIDSIRGNLEQGLEHINKSLDRNSCNHRARHIKVNLLRRLGRLDEARQYIEESLALDKFNICCRFERYLIEKSEKKDAETILVRKEIVSMLRGAVHNYLEYAIDFYHLGQFAEAEELLDFLLDQNDKSYPMIYYALGYLASQRGDNVTALKYYRSAEQMSSDYCFPNKTEEVLMLLDAMRLNPEGAKAPYYLGNFWYNAKQYGKAQECWEKSAKLDDTFPIVFRNLSLVYYNKVKDTDLARKCIERAFELNPLDARVLMELDQLYKKLKYSHKQRLDFLEEHLDLVKLRDDLSVERITLYNQLGNYQRALDLIMERKFHPWEGGEGKVSGQYIYALTELAKDAIRNGEYKLALEYLDKTDHYPRNLGEGKLSTVPENEVHYWKGVAYEGLSDWTDAEKEFKEATHGSTEPTIAFFYNDEQPDNIYYQGLAWGRLHESTTSKARFHSLVKHGIKHLFDQVKIDYFAVSLPELLIWDDDLNVRNKIHCNYVMGLGYLGLGEKQEAKKYFETVLQMDINHQGTLAMLKEF